MFLVWPCVCSVFSSVLPAFTCPFLFLFHSICSLHACRARPRGPASRLPTFPPVRARRWVHRVYSDTADSAATPPDSHAPRRGPIAWRSRSDHAPPRPWLAAARYTFDFDWLRVTTRQTALNFVSVFFVFFPVLSAEASLLAAAQRSDWSSSSCTRSCRRPFLHSSVRSFSSSTQPRCCQVSFQKLGMLELCGTARGSRTSGFGVRGRSGSAAPVGLFRLGSARLGWAVLALSAGLSEVTVNPVTPVCARAREQYQQLHPCSASLTAAETLQMFSLFWYSWCFRFRVVD